MAAHPDDKTRSRMQKLLELARRGVGGEAANAERFLAKLLAKHGMTMDDITDDGHPRTKVELRYRDLQDRELLLQIVAKVVDAVDFPSWRWRGKQVLIVELTPAEHAEVRMHHAALAPALAKHMRRAMQAFVQVNRLFPETDNDDAPGKPMDKAELDAIVQMMLATRRTTVRQALPGPEGGA